MDLVPQRRKILNIRDIINNFTRIEILGNPLYGGQVTSYIMEQGPLLVVMFL